MEELLMNRSRHEDMHSAPLYQSHTVQEKAERDTQQMNKIANNVSWVELILFFCIFAILALIKGHINQNDQINQLS